MTLFDQFEFQTPVLRVNNRNRNIDFYQHTLGFKLVTEENALAIFTAWKNKDALFIIEESPSTVTRAVKGPKKLNKIIIKVQDPLEIESLLANDDHQAKIIYQGKKGYAFEAVSPENDVFLVHAEDDLADLKAVSYADVALPSPDFKGLSDFTVETIALNVPDPKAAKEFYETLFEEQFPVRLAFMEAEGEDLTIAADQTWDLEILEIKVPQDYPLADLKEYLEENNVSSYLDVKDSVLALTDLSNIEIWFVK